MTASLNAALDRLEDEGKTGDTDALYEAFSRWAENGGRALYPHQEESLIELLSGNHVIAETPTGSGKSLIALAAHFISLAQGGRSYYTAPLKALVSEKFFDLVDTFGAHNVGMITGDVSLNSDAPIICCTAEILANQALREGAALDTDMVIMDEFHFYGDPQRGWAWQIPLLELTKPQFTLLSATLGDTDEIATDLLETTGRETAVISDAIRPVPLEFAYLSDELPTVVERLITEGRAPIYIVHFAQADAVKTAVDLSRGLKVPKEQKALIQAALRGTELSRGFGKTLRELLLNGVGVHHAGMLPRYRRLVERLTQRGLLSVICGTDTLGVGINVPIRTVLFTSLVKFDGRRSRHLSAREFHQISGRAGRPGFDAVGFVRAIASPEEIEAIIRKARMTAAQEAGDAKKKKKLAKKTPSTKRAGKLSWSKGTFERLVQGRPEVLQPRFQTSHAMFLNVLAGEGDAETRLLSLAEKAKAYDQRDKGSNIFLRELGDIYRSLLQAGLVERVIDNGTDTDADPRKPQSRLRAVGDLPDDFALNQPLAPFALAALDLLDRESPTFTVDVVSIIESVMEDPLPVLYAQQRAERDRAYQAAREEGLDFEQRRDAVAEVTWPQPLTEIILPTFNIFAQTNPWVKGRYPSPKRILREMVEDGFTFSQLIARYDLFSAEGVVLRYLSDIYRALRQILPSEYQTEEMVALIEWLKNMLSSVDSSLLSEWEDMIEGRVRGEDALDAQLKADAEAESAFGAGPDGQILFAKNRHAMRVSLRNASFRWVELLARDNPTALARRASDMLTSETGANGSVSTAADHPLFARTTDADWWANRLDRYYAEHEWIRIDAVARSAEMFHLNETPQSDEILDACNLDTADELPLTASGTQNWWPLEQIIADPDDTGEWRLTLLVDPEESLRTNQPVVHAVNFAPM